MPGALSRPLPRSCRATRPGRRHRVRAERCPAQAQGRPDVADRQGRLAQGQASLLPLLHNYQRPETPILGSIAPTDRFRSAVQDAKIGPDKDIPHVTAAVIVKYITDLQLLGLL